MSNEEQELLCQLAYQIWLERIRPVGTPEADLESIAARIRAVRAAPRPGAELARQRTGQAVAHGT